MENINELEAESKFKMSVHRGIEAYAQRDFASTSEDEPLIGEISKYLFYFSRDGKYSCVNAISPYCAVTPAHGKNQTLIAKVHPDREGDKFDVFSFTTSQQIRVEVVFMSDLEDLVILQAIDGQKFFTANTQKTDILSSPKSGQDIFIWGLSSGSKISPRPCYNHGKIMNTELDERDLMEGAVPTWPCDYGVGGGLFSDDGKTLVGFISSMIRPKEEPNNLTVTRFLFVPSASIRNALHYLGNESGPDSVFAFAEPTEYYRNGRLVSVADVGEE